MRKFLLASLFTAISAMGTSTSAQHLLGGNVGFGPALVEGYSGYLVTTVEYNVHFWQRLGIGAKVGHVFGFEPGKMGPVGRFHEDLNSLTVSFHAEYQQPLGNIMPYVGCDVGGSFFEREGLFLMPTIGTRAFLKDHFVMDFSVRNPLFFRGLENGAITFNVGFHYFLGDRD